MCIRLGSFVYKVLHRHFIYKAAQAYNIFIFLQMPENYYYRIACCGQDVLKINNILNIYSYTTSN